MRRELYYVSPEDVRLNVFILRETEAHHCFKVMRHKKGDIILATDGKGMEYRGMIKRVTDDRVECEILGKKRKPRESLLQVHLAFGIIKGPRMDVLIEKATELGVYEFIPLITEYTVVEWENPSAKIERLRRIALSAVKQSLRSYLPEIRKPVKFSEIMDEVCVYDGAFLADEGGERLKERDRRIRKVLLLVGPEGGFSDREKEMARKKGVRFFSLGERRLRTETAAIVGVSNIFFVYE